MLLASSRHRKVKDSRMYGPDGGQLDLKITGQTTCSLAYISAFLRDGLFASFCPCVASSDFATATHDQGSFQMGSEVYKGTLNSEGKLEWNDGAVWIRVNGADSDQTVISEGCVQHVG